MSDKEDSTITSWFKGIGLKFKVFFGAVMGLAGVIVFFLFQKKMTARQILELELKKLREEIEIEKAQEEINKNNEIIINLEEKIKSVKKEIEELEEFEKRENVSKEELDDFFDKRGF